MFKYIYRLDQIIAPLIKKAYSLNDPEAFKELFLAVYEFLNEEEFVCLSI